MLYTSQTQHTIVGAREKLNSAENIESMQWTEKWRNWKSLLKLESSSNKIEYNVYCN